MNIYYDDHLHKRYSNLQLIELKNQVILSHENYLRIDDNEQRDEYRKKLTKLVYDYLFKIPNQNKFILKDSYLIFERCIDKNDDFHPLKSAESFDYLFTIINNLILKPWRKEFHRINIYNAYFKYSISKQIPNYEHILKLIGYEEKNKNGILNYYLTKRISIDILKLISFDCFISSIEFKFYYHFGQLLINKNIKPNWLFLLKLRKKFCGDLDATLDNYLLIYKDHLEYDNINLKKSNDDTQEQINKKYKHLSNLISKYEANLNQTNNRLNNNLIDLDSLPTNNGNNYDLEQLLLNSSIDNETSTLNNNLNNSSSFTNNSFKLNQQLNNQQEPIKLKNTYTNNEIINANNYLQCSDGYSSSINRNGVEETDLDQVDYIDSELNNSINNLKNELNSNIKYLNNNSQKLENILKSDENDKLINGKIKSNSLEKKTNKNSKLIDKKYSTLDCRSGDKNKLKKKDDKKWQCKHCTYLNDKQDQICKICSKSNLKLNNKNDQLQVLGKECSLCTLVNKQNESSCRVCGSSLVNSPTYI